jgi:hypothetical protein
MEGSPGGPSLHLRPRGPMSLEIAAVKLCCSGAVIGASYWRSIGPAQVDNEKKTTSLYHNRTLYTDDTCTLNGSTVKEICYSSFSRKEAYPCSATYQLAHGREGQVDCKVCMPSPLTALAACSWRICVRIPTIPRDPAPSPPDEAQGSGVLLRSAIERLHPAWHGMAWCAHCANRTIAVYQNTPPG